MSKRDNRDLVTKKKERDLRLRIFGYFDDETWVNQIVKSHSGYYTREKAWKDFEQGKQPCPPTKQGYYFKEYMAAYEDAQSGLPF